jgi:hypothetical protein
MRCLSIERCLTRCRRKRASSRSSRMRGSGSQIAGTKSRWLSVASTRESILSVLQANGARPFTFLASAISTSQPSCSSVSWTSLAPVIDSTTAQTGSPWASSIRRASLVSESASGGIASRSKCSPAPDSRHTSTFLRLRSNPACNIEAGPPLNSPLGDSRSVPPEGALLHGSPLRASREAEPVWLRSWVSDTLRQPQCRMPRPALTRPSGGRECRVASKRAATRRA